MKKTFNIVLILSILVFIQTANAAEISIGTGKCNSDGSLSFIAETTSDKRVTTSNLKVYAEYKDKVFGVHGNWSTERIRTQGAENPTTFTSPFGQLNYSGDYIVFIEPSQCDNADECELTLKGCPGFLYDCNLAKLEVESCYTENNIFYLYFSGLNKNQFDKLDVSHAIIKKINTPNRMVLGEETLPNLKKKKIKGDSYLITFETEDKPLNVMMGIDKCDYKNTVYKKCSLNVPDIAEDEPVHFAYKRWKDISNENVYEKLVYQEFTWKVRLSESNYNEGYVLFEIDGSETPKLKQGDTYDYGNLRIEVEKLSFYDKWNLPDASTNFYYLPNVEVTEEKTTASKTVQTTTQPDNLITVNPLTIELKQGETGKMIVNFKVPRVNVAYTTGIYFGLDVTDPDGKSCFDLQGTHCTVPSKYSFGTPGSLTTVGEVKEFTITYSPTEDTPQGDYPYTVNLICSVEGGCDPEQRFTKDIVVSVKAKEKEIEESSSFEEITQTEPSKQTLDIASLIEGALTQTITLSEGQGMKFEVFGEEHSIIVDDINSTHAIVTIKSTPLTFVIELLKSIVVDFNNDGKGDLKLTLTKSEDGKASLNLSKPEPTEEVSQPNEKETLTLPKIPKFIFYIVVLSVLLIIGGFGTTSYLKKKGKGEKKEEITEEVEEKPKQKIKLSGDAISIKGLTVKHGKNVILDNIDLKINPEEFTAILGPSGTGKSTIIEALIGRKKPNKGEIKIFNHKIKDIIDNVGFVPQSPELYMNQTVIQNMQNSSIKWKIKKPNIDGLLKKLNLSNRKDVKASKLSGGQQKLLSLGMELIRDPELLVLDEPTTGLDPNNRNEVITILSRLVTNMKKSVIITTHFMDDAEECDNVIILVDKNTIVQDSPSKLEKRLPGGGKVVNIILDNITDDLVEKIEKIEGIKKVVGEGRNLRIITEEPNAIKLGQKINEVGGVVNETKIDKATMMEVFVYHTGKKPEE